MAEKNYYPLRVWATSIIVSPIIIYLFYLLRDLPDINFAFSDFAFILVLIPMGGALLLPTFLGYTFAFDWLSKHRYSTFSQKLISILVAASMIFISYYFLIPKIFGIFFDYKKTVLPIIYSLAFGFTSFFFSTKEQ